MKENKTITALQTTSYEQVHISTSIFIKTSSCRAIISKRIMCMIFYNVLTVNRPTIQRFFTCESSGVANNISNGCSLSVLHLPPLTSSQLMHFLGALWTCWVSIHTSPISTYPSPDCQCCFMPRFLSSHLNLNPYLLLPAPALSPILSYSVQICNPCQRQKKKLENTELSDSVLSNLQCCWSNGNGSGLLWTGGYCSLSDQHAECQCKKCPVHCKTVERRL